MSRLKTDIKDPKDPSIVVVIKPKEGVTETMLKDAVTFGFLGLGVYISQGSKFWTFIAGTMFLLGIILFLIRQRDDYVKRFSSIEKAIDYLVKYKAVMGTPLDLGEENPDKPFSDNH